MFKSETTETDCVLPSTDGALSETRGTAAPPHGDTPPGDVTPQSGAAAYARNIPLYFAYVIASNLAFPRSVFLLYLAVLGFSDAQSGTFQAILFALSFLSEVPTGILGDRFGRKWSVVIGTMLMLCVSVGMLTGPRSMEFVAALFALNGVAFAFVSGAAGALVYDSMAILGRKDQYLRVNARAHACQAVTLGIALVAGGYMSQVSWRLVYGAHVGVLALAVLFLLAMHERRSDYAGSEAGEDAPRPSMIQTLRAFAATPFGKRMILFSSACALVEATTTPYFIFGQRLFKEYGMAASHIGIVYASVQIISSLIMTVSGNALSTKLHISRFMILGTLMVAGLVSLNAVGSKPLALALFVVVCVIPDIIFVVADRYLQERIPSAVRATLLSAHSLVMAVGITAGYLVWGVLCERLTLPVAYACSSVLTMGAVALFAAYFARPADAYKATA